MRGPTQKPFDPVVSPLFVDAIQEELRRYDGRRAGDARPCPNCGSGDHRKNGYQNAPKTVARLVTRDGIEDVGVQVQQYECKDCGRSFQGDLSELFYQGCDYARPVVDLCLFHARRDSPSACERSLRRMYGLQVNRDTVERYTERFDADAMAFHPVDIAGHTYSLGFLSFLFGDDDTDQPQFVLTDKTALW